MHFISIDPLLTTRLITREQDTDYFIETLSYPINLISTLPYLSRIQFPQSRALLVRTSPLSPFVTIHVLKDSDLYSSFVNFEIDLTQHTLNVTLKEGYIEVLIKSQQEAL